MTSRLDRNSTYSSGVQGSATIFPRPGIIEEIFRAPLHQAFAAQVDHQAALYLPDNEKRRVLGATEETALRGIMLMEFIEALITKAALHDPPV